MGLVSFAAAVGVGAAARMVRTSREHSPLRLSANAARTLG